MPVIGPKCKQCSKGFRTTDERRKFCSLECYWQWRRENKSGGEFEKGSTPWNVGTKGVMKANSGTFMKGRDNESKQEIGSVTIRNDKKGRSRAWIKIADNGTSYDWELRAVIV